MHIRPATRRIALQRPANPATGRGCKYTLNQYPLLFHRRVLVTSISTPSVGVCVLFLNGAEAVYGKDGLAPATARAAGVDLRACLPEGEKAVIAPGERLAVPSGIAIEPLQPGIAGFVYSRSGLGAVKGLTVAQGVGLIDPDYRGEIIVFLLNTSREPRTVERGDRIAQLVFQGYVQPVFRQVTALGGTDRGAGGFGHTGKK